VDIPLREKAMMFVTELAGERAKALKKKHLLPMIFQTCFALASEVRAVCCSVLQCVAVCCSVLQSFAIHDFPDVLCPCI